jgi:hypothetical protein
VIDYEDDRKGKMRGKSVNGNINKRKIKVTDCDLKEMNIIFIR